MMTDKVLLALRICTMLAGGELYPSAKNSGSDTLDTRWQTRTKRS
jgi:hypothetical protein